MFPSSPIKGFLFLSPTINPGHPQCAQQPVLAEELLHSSLRASDATLVSHHGERGHYLSCEEEGGALGGGFFRGGDLLVDSNQLCDFLHGPPDLSLFGEEYGLGADSSFVLSGPESSGQSINSTPSWADVLSFGGVDTNLDGQMIPSYEVSDLASGCVSGILDSSIDFERLGNVIQTEGGYDSLDTMFTTELQNGKQSTLTNQRQCVDSPLSDLLQPPPANATMAPPVTCTSTMHANQNTDSEHLLANNTALKSATARSPANATLQHPGSSSSITQSPPEVTARASSLRRKRGQPSALDPVEAAVEKRRRNTLAARRFRQRQQDRITQLEKALEQVSRERDELKVHVAKCEGEMTVLRRILGNKLPRE